VTGPEHYAEAERLLASVAADLPKSDAEIPGMAVLMRMAQAHATLAQVVYLREIGDQLDTFPRPGRRCGEVDNLGQQCNLSHGHGEGHRVGGGSHAS
jgi:hypothetical protein